MVPDFARQWYLEATTARPASSRTSTARVATIGLATRARATRRMPILDAGGEHMAFEVGDRVYAEKSGRRRRTARQPLRSGRHGVVVKVLRGDPNPRYEIKWDEGI